MRTRNSKKKALFDSSEEMDNSDMEAKKPRKSIDSVYSTEDSNASQGDASGTPEEEDFSQLKPGSSKRRVPPNVSSDDEGTSQTRPRKSSDSQYSSDGAVKSPKKRNLKMRLTSESEESESPEIQPKRPRKCKKKRQPQHVASSSSEDNSVSQAQSSGSQTEELSDSSSSTVSDRSDPQAGPARSRSPSVVSYTTDECEDFIERGSDSEVSEKSNEPSQASEVEIAPRVSPKKYTNLRVGSNSSDEDQEEPEPVEESPDEIRRRQQLEYVCKQLKSKILYAKAAEIRDIVAGCGELVLPEFSELLWQAVTHSKIDPDKPAILVRAGVDVNRDGPGEYSGNSVLHVVAEKALRKGFEGLAFTLMKHGAEIDWCNCEGKTVLHSAVIGGSVEVIEELLRRDVELGEDYKQILQVAAESSCNSAEILRLLVEYKAADKEMKIRRAMHALRCLVEKGNDLAAMKVLLDYKLPLDEIFNDGQTLLHRAIFLSRKEMVQLLLGYGANPRQKRRDGTIPLWHAAVHPTTEITGLLIKYGASVHDCNYDDAYPIHKACNAMSLENIKFFLYLGAKVNVTDNYNNWTPFDMITISDMNDANKIMIQHLAFITSKNSKIHSHDLQKIRQNPAMRKYYAQCLSELEKMKRLIIFEDISIHSLLDYNVDKISHVTKNTKLIDEYHENRNKITADFPIYSSVIRKRMMSAWWRRDKLNSIESAIEEASKYVLTPDVCEKIAYFACYESFIDYDLKEKSY